MKALVLTLALTLGLSTAAIADEGERFGEVHITLRNAEYCKVEVNGAEYNATEFERGGKQLLVKGLPLSDAPFEVTLIPFDRNLAPGTLTVTEEAFKKVRKGRVFFLIATGSLKFEAKPKDDAGERRTAPAPPPEEPAGPPPDVDEL